MKLFTVKMKNKKYDAYKNKEKFKLYDISCCNGFVLHVYHFDTKQEMINFIFEED